MFRLFRRRSKKISKLRVTGLCEGNRPVTGTLPSQGASNAKNVSVSWRHHCFFHVTRMKKSSQMQFNNHKSHFGEYRTYLPFFSQPCVYRLWGLDQYHNATMVPMELPHSILTRNKSSGPGVAVRGGWWWWRWCLFQGGRLNTKMPLCDYRNPYYQRSFTYSIYIGDSYTYNLLMATNPIRARKCIHGYPVSQIRLTLPEPVLTFDQ